MNNDSIIFDIDGTLWNACPAIAKGWNAGLAKLNINKKVVAEQIESVAGNPHEQCIEILLPGLQAQYPELLPIFNDCEIKAVRTDGGTFYDSVIDGIKELADLQRIFLVSNCQDWYMQVFFEFSELGPLLDGFDCCGMSGLPKDQMLSRIRSDYSLNNPVYIGDTAGDEKAANLANMEFIHAGYGFGRPENKAKSFDSFAALLDYFKK